MNKNYINPLIIAILLCTAFTIGFQVVDHVSAASWKKYDSGSYIEDFPPAGYSKYGKYQSYTKGNNQLYVNIYVYKKGSNKKHLVDKVIFTKKNNEITMKDRTDYKNKKGYYYEYSASLNTKLSVKSVYKSMMKENKKSNPKEKQAFHKKTVKVSEGTLKTYAIYSSTFKEIRVHGYINGEEVMTISMWANKDKYTKEIFNKNRKCVYTSNSKDFPWNSLKEWYYNTETSTDDLQLSYDVAT